MLFEERQNLEESIVRLLSVRPGLSAGEIMRISSQLDRPFCTAAVYKELAKLLERGVLVKIKRRYSLSLTWTLDVLSFSQRLSENYLKNPRATFVLPEPGREVCLKFTNLLRVNDFSSHIILLLVALSEDKRVFSWNPHPWFYLVQTSQESGYIRGLKKSGGKFFKVIGGETYLDRWTTQFWKDQKTTAVRFLPNAFEANRRLYFNVVGDFIASFMLDSAAAKMIDSLYGSVKSYRQLDLPQLFESFQRRVRATFRVKHDRKAAAALRLRFKPFFQF